MHKILLCVKLKNSCWSVMQVAGYTFIVCSKCLCIPSNIACLVWRCDISFDILSHTLLFKSLNFTMQTVVRCLSEIHLFIRWFTSNSILMLIVRGKMARRWLVKALSGINYVELMFVWICLMSDQVLTLWNIVANHIYFTNWTCVWFFVGCEATVAKFQYINIQCWCQASELHSSCISGLFSNIHWEIYTCANHVKAINYKLNWSLIQTGTGYNV